MIKNIIIATLLACAHAMVCCCSGIVMPTMQCYDDPADCSFSDDCANAPPGTPPVLPDEWKANETVYRGDTAEYHGMIWASFSRCAVRRLQIWDDGKLPSHYAIYHYDFGNESAQCTFNADPPEHCSRGFLRSSDCGGPWDPFVLKQTSFNGSEAINGRSCDAWLAPDSLGNQKFWLGSEDGLPCRYESDSGRMDYTDASADKGVVPVDAFDCPCSH